VDGLPGYAVDRAAGDRGHSMKQTAGCRRTMQSLGDRCNAARQLWFNSRDDLGHLRKCFPHRRSGRLGYDRQQFLGGQANQRQEVFGRLLLALRFGCHVGQMLHHAVGVDFPYRADFTFPLCFPFTFSFPLAFQFVLGF
jgi:hypothetical protein